MSERDTTPIYTCYNGTKALYCDSLFPASHSDLCCKGSLCYVVPVSKISDTTLLFYSSFGVYLYLCQLSFLLIDKNVCSNRQLVSNLNLTHLHRAFRQLLTSIPVSTSTRLHWALWVTASKSRKPALLSKRKCRRKKKQESFLVRLRRS